MRKKKEMVFSYEIKYIYISELNGGNGTLMVRERMEGKGSLTS